MANSKLPRTWRPVLCFEDGENGNTVRIVDHEGVIYLESRGRHNGDEVYTLVRVDRLQCVPALLGWFS